MLQQTQKGLETAFKPPLHLFPRKNKPPKALLAQNPGALYLWI